MQRIFFMDKNLQDIRRLATMEVPLTDPLTDAAHPLAGDGEQPHAVALQRAGAARETLLASYRSVLFAAVNWRRGPDVRVIGFKEVRWLFTEGLGDVKILMEMLPCAKLLLSYREDVGQQAKSGFWTIRNSNHTKVLQELQESNDAMKQLHARAPTATRLVSMDELNSKEAVQAMVDWLDPERRLGCTVIGLPHYNSNGTLDKASLADICTERGCTRRPDYMNQFLRCS